MALKPIKLDNETRKQLSKKLDPKLIKTRDQFGGKGKLSYISANTCIDLLNKAFGHNWSMRIVDRWMEEGVPSPFVAKNGKEPQPQPPTAWCIVELSVNVVDENGNTQTITKSAFGSQSITGNQAVQSQNGYKGAQSDAIKKAATLFGIALELYRDGTEEEYFNMMNEELFVVWTEELIEQYSEEFSYINAVLDVNGYSVEDLAWWVSSACNGKATNLYSMPEDCIGKLVELLKEDTDLIQPEPVEGK